MTKKNVRIALAAMLLLPSIAAANGLNLNGLGTRAQAMGGAYVGIADDFSAVFWNPAGAAGFTRRTFGFFATDLIPTATYRQELVDAKTQTSHYLGFLAGYYHPVSSKVVVGVGFSTPSGLGTMWSGTDFLALTGGTLYDWSSKVGVLSISPMVAVKLGPAISLGATININYGSFALMQPGGTADLGEGTVDLGQYDENMNGWGFGATFGVLVKPVDKLSVGLTVRTPSTVSFKGLANLSNMTLYGLPGSSNLERKITWPLWIAGGVSFRPTGRLLLSADVHWTQWSTLDSITTDYLNAAWAGLAAIDGKDERVLDWADALQVRFGAEYMLDATTALRAGYYNDPAPGPESTLNVLLPTHTFNAFSVGIGKTIGDVQLDFGLEYLAGVDRTTTYGPPDAMPGDYGSKVVVPTVSVSTRF